MVNNASMGAHFHAIHPNVFPPAPPGVQVGGAGPVQQAPQAQPVHQQQVPGGVQPGPMGASPMDQSTQHQQAPAVVQPGAAGGQAGG